MATHYIDPNKKYNRDEAAEAMGLQPATLSRKLRKFGIGGGLNVFKGSELHPIVEAMLQSRQLAQNNRRLSVNSRRGPNGRVM